MKAPSPRVAFSVAIDDAGVRARVIDALCGTGAPRGIERCEERGSVITIELDPDRSVREIVEALIAIECRRSSSSEEEEPLTREAAVRTAAEGLGDPSIGVGRVIETYLDGDACRC